MARVAKQLAFNEAACASLFWAIRAFVSPVIKRCPPFWATAIGQAVSHSAPSSHVEFTLHLYIRHGHPGFHGTLRLGHVLPQRFEYSILDEQQNVGGMDAAKPDLMRPHAR